jgi:FKBP-type peptidyl-prolyl cis-trans isomerase (trigger factor)
LIGKSLGEVCFEKTTLPSSYENYGGEEVDIKITIKSIIKKIDPTNEELVVRTESPSYEELISALHQKTNQVSQDRQVAALEELAIDKILELHEFDVPESWVSNESKYMLSQFGMSEAPDEQTAEFVKNMAVRNVRKTFMIEAIYDVEPNLKVTQADLEEVVESEAKKNNVSSLVVKKEWQEKNIIQSVLALIKHKKVMKFVLENSQISDAVVLPSAPLIVEAE